jgi:hypothetical protein
MISNKVSLLLSDREAVGSSKINISGCRDNAFAIYTICFCPAESVLTCVRG